MKRRRERAPRYMCPRVPSTHAIVTLICAPASGYIGVVVFHDVCALGYEDTWDVMGTVNNEGEYMLLVCDV